MPNRKLTSAVDAASGTEVLSGHDPLGLARQIPDRYRIQQTNSGPVIQCTDAPNLKVQVSRELSVSASAARKAAPGSIFLDGVARCEPFMDHEKQIYNLDHHEGCVRAFTLATCEQALILSLKGLDLRDREWNIMANEPDLDTVLAIWILLNHRRLQDRGFANRQRLLTLVRLEGTIDALGLELKEFSGLPPDLAQSMQRLIDHLRREEMRLKKDALWDEANYLEYTADLLHQIDRMIFRPSDFTDFQEIKELARADINGKRIVVAVEADMGIYEIEPRLKTLYGERLGWVILKKGPKTYTLRQMDIFMPVTLEQVYDRLNFIDAAVRYRNRQNHWGGSVEIGGSPRETGTRLSPQEIVNACRDAVQDQGLLRQSYRFLEAAGMVFLAMAGAVAGRHFWPTTAWLTGIERAHVIASPSFGMYLGLMLATFLMLVAVAFRRPWQYGLAAPEGKQWWIYLPIVVMGGLAGVGDLYRLPDHMTHPGDIWFLGIIMAPIGIEMLFRSLIHGFLAQSARIGRPKSPVFFSWPMVGAALLFAIFAAGHYISVIPFKHLTEKPLMILPSVIGIFLMGLIMGLVRERSQSILPPILFQMAAAATYIAATHFVL